MRAYRVSVAVFAGLFVLIGLALVGRTAAAGGGGLGFVLGALFTALGSARLWLLLRKGR